MLDSKDCYRHHQSPGAEELLIGNIESLNTVFQNSNKKCPRRYNGPFYQKFQLQQRVISSPKKSQHKGKIHKGIPVLSKRRRSPYESFRKEQQDKLNLKKSEAERKVYVKNIPFSFSNQQLYNIACEYGEIEHCSICKDKRTRKSKTDYAFIVFARFEDAQKLLSKGKVKLRVYKTKLVFRPFVFKGSKGNKGSENLSNFEGKIYPERKDVKGNKPSKKACFGLGERKKSNRSSRAKQNIKLRPYLDFRCTGDQPLITSFHSKALLKVSENHKRFNVRLNY